MEITGFKEFCYTGNYGEITIFGVEDSIILMLSDVTSTEVILEENYTPDADGFIRIHDLGKVLQAHLNLRELSFSEMNQEPVSILFQIKGSDDTVLYSATQQIAYSRSSAVFGDGKQNFDRFISRYSKKQTTINRQEMVSFFHNGQVFAYAIAYQDNDGVKAVEHKTDVVMMDMVLATKNVSLNRILNLAQSELGLTIIPGNVIYYDVILYKEDLLIDRIRFYNDTRSFLYTTSFLYYNLLGLPETVTFTGKEEISQELNAEFAYMTGIYRKYNAGPVEIKKANSGYITKEALHSIRDMVSSPVVYLYEGEVIKDEIVITEVDFTRKQPNNEPVSVMITYRKADNLQDEFSRSDYDDMIFYDTFETTFV